MTTILILSAIGVVAMLYIQHHLQKDLKQERRLTLDLRKEYNQLHQMWVDEGKKATTLYGIVDLNEIAIKEYKQLNTSLRLSRNGVRGNCELQKRNLNAKLNHANSTVAQLMDEVRNKEMVIRLLKLDFQQQLDDKEAQAKVSNSIASKLMIKCSNQEKRIVLLKEDVSKLRDITRLAATEQLPTLSPTDDLPIGTKFVYEGVKLEVQLDKYSCEPCFFAQWLSPNNEACSDAHRCYSSDRKDNQSIIYKQIN
jgi:hypothetical protein